METNIIAEIGWNHMGDMELAKKMIKSAYEAGADYAKFQTWSTKNLKSGPWDTDGRLELYEKAQLSIEQHYVLRDYCNQLGINFLTSIFNHNDAEWLSELSNNCIKIPSMEIQNLDIINAVDGKFDVVIISTGASSWEEILNAKKNIKNSKLHLMHCVSSYPTQAKNVNLPRMKKLNEIHSHVGYSGHLKGINDAIASLHFNPTFIEKHFTIDNNLPGRDNQFSITPIELKSLVDYKNDFELMNRDLGHEMQEIESDVNINYRGRWS